MLASLFDCGKRAGALVALLLISTFVIPTRIDAQTTARPSVSEGQAAAKRLWETILTKCGESYYYGGSALHIVDEFKEAMIAEPPPNPHKNFGNPLALSVAPAETQPNLKKTSDQNWNSTTGWLWEYKGVTFKMNQLPLSHADSLNGMQWKGVFRMESSAWRESDANGKWENWNETAPRFDEGRIKVLAQKINGAWVYSPASPWNEDTDFNDPKLSTKIPAAELKPFSRASCGAEGQGAGTR